MTRIALLLLVLTTSFSSIVAAPEDKSFEEKLSDSAKQRTQHVVIYNGAYRKIPYPNGDVPKIYGVCTDVIIRSYRKLGIDLQQNVHQDMLSSFQSYPKFWGLKKPDANIDHRRVPNLQTFFSRNGDSLGVSNNPSDYKTGDIVTWMLSGNLPHIGIVVDSRSSDGQRPMIVHNIGWGPKMDDMLFDYPITGHYRYQPIQQSIPK
jgi:hypothetical protein